MTSEADWELHCQDHLDKLDIPLRCDPVTFRYATACAGYCPSCLRDSTLSAAQRMRQFPKRALWLEHVEKHVEEDIKGIDFSKPVLCLHSLCTEPCAFESPQDLREHLQDGHSIPMPSSGKKRRFGTENQPDTQEGKSDTVKRKRLRLQGKLHTAVLDPKPGQSGCHEIKSEP